LYTHRHQGAARQGAAAAAAAGDTGGRAAQLSAVAGAVQGAAQRGGTNGRWSGRVLCCGLSAGDLWLIGRRMTRIFGLNIKNSRNSEDLIGTQRIRAR